MATTPRRLAILAGALALCVAGLVLADRYVRAEEHSPAAPASPPDPAAPPGPDAPPAEPDAPAAPVPPAAEPYTPRACDVLLMFSGLEKGLLKPCGCSSPQRGGLGRRAALFERARVLAKGAAALSVGGTLGQEAADQNNMKAELHRSALSAMGYSGLLLSADDLSPFTPSVWQPYGSPEETPRPPLNVKLRATGPLAASAGVDPILRFQVGGVPVRAVSIVDPTSQYLLQDVAEIVVSADMAIKALAKEPGILVIASHVMREDIAILVGAAAGKADAVVVVDVRGEVAGRTPVRGHAFGRPILVGFDEMGKEVVLVTLDKTPAGWIAGSDTVQLDPVYEEGASKGRDQVASLFSAYRKRVRDEGLLEKYPTFDDEGARYVGAEVCKSCHAAIYESWSTSKHAHAMQTLVDLDSEADPECVRCHSIGWQRARDSWLRAKSGFQTLTKTPERANVQCESCHGPSSEHVKWPDRRDLFLPGPPTEESDRKAGKIWRHPGKQPVTGCMKCHDPENSVDFDKAGNYENVYLPQVDHREVEKALRTVRPK